MFHKAIDLIFKDGTVLEMTFQNGEVKEYDMARLFDKYPMLAALRDRELFTTGRLMGTSGVVWNDELDIEAETIYEEGVLVRTIEVPTNMEVAYAIVNLRSHAGLSQKELAQITGIDQSDISKLERGLGNPSINTLRRIADALGAKVKISFEE